MTGFASLLRNRQAVIGMVMIGAVVFCALFAPWLAPNDPQKIDLSKSFMKSSWEFPLGTDPLGQCVLSRLLFGARYSLLLAGVVLFLTGFISIALGTLSAYYGGVVDRVITALCDVFMAFPPLVFILAFVGALGPGMVNLMASMVLAMWVWYARIVRGQALVEKNKNYILLAKVAGLSDFRIIVKHLLPNIMPALIVFYTLGVGEMIFMISGFSFLGLGVEAGLPEWGSMLNEAKRNIYTQPYFMFYPGLCILFTVCGFNLFGEALRDILSPEEAREGKQIGKRGVEGKKFMCWFK